MANKDNYFKAPKKKLSKRGKLLKGFKANFSQYITLIEEVKQLGEKDVIWLIPRLEKILVKTEGKMQNLLNTLATKFEDDDLPF